MQREDLKRLAARVPPFTNPKVRDGAVRTVRRLRKRRRLFYERMGSPRLSRPALHGLDRRLAPYLPETGVFVEAGANDGYQHSNTYYLERFKGWIGVLIEPIPELFRECVAERPRSRVFNCALVPASGPGEVTMRYHNLKSALSSEDEPLRADAGTWDSEYEVKVPARTLSSVLDEASPGEIDLLSLDVEGFEVDVLQGLDLDRHAPRLLLIETNGADEDIELVLGDRYERVAQLPPNDALYRRRDT